MLIIRYIDNIAHLATITGDAAQNLTDSENPTQSLSFPGSNPPFPLQWNQGS